MMQYPTVSLNVIQGFLAEVATEGEMADPPQYVIRGSGEDFFDKNLKFLRSIQESLAKEVAAADKKTNPDEIEGLYSVKVFEAFHSLPVEVLTDRDFWRYLSSHYFFEFTVWRDGDDGKLPSNKSFGASSRSLSSFDCVPYRMFNRGLLNYLLTQDLSDSSYAAVPGTDIWRSHILRVKTAFSPHLVRSYIEKLEAKKLPTGLVRPLAKRFRRDRSNILFEILDEAAAADLFDRDYHIEASSQGRAT